LIIVGGPRRFAVRAVVLRQQQGALSAGRSRA
jgi:hypothetical protein